MSAEIVNMEELIEKLKMLGNPERLNSAIDKACLLVETDAKRQCPVDDGQLRQSITHEVEDKEGIVGTNVEYAPYVEFGTGIFASKGNGRQDRWRYKDAEGKWHSTVGQKPQPYLEPALKKNRKKIAELIGEEIRKGARQ